MDCGPVHRRSPKPACARILRPRQLKCACPCARGVDSLFVLLIKVPLVFTNLNGSRDEIGDCHFSEPFWAGCAAVQNTVGGNESMALRGVGFGRWPWWR